mmetsp:Transcript_22375/g.55280  ORF Transcript_22375/g.55280 Transcript_22375/m.55280 type:complete len:310 (-) Transcript_22375:639-1568(-)
MTFSPGRWASSSTSALQGSPRTSARPPAATGSPMAGQRRFFDAGQSLRSGRCASRVWITGMEAARAAARTRAAAGMAAIKGDTSLPRDPPKPPGWQKSFCQSIMTSAAAPAGHINAEGVAAGTDPAVWHSPACMVATRRASFACALSGSRGRGSASNALATSSTHAVAPKTPPCMCTILMAAAWFAGSVAAVPSSSSRHSYPRSFASRIVVCTHTSVVMPPRMRRLTPHDRSTRSMSVLAKVPLPGLSMMSSPGRGASSGIRFHPGSPRVRILPQGPASPMPMPPPACLLRQRLLAGRSASDGRWPSRV